MVASVRCKRKALSINGLTGIGPSSNEYWAVAVSSRSSQSWMVALTLPMVSLSSAPVGVALPEGDLAAVCMPPLKRNTKCKVAAFWML